jgi:hypothetical protein
MPAEQYGARQYSYSALCELLEDRVQYSGTTVTTTAMQSAFL